MSKRKVLFLCTHNSARSQMAEGLLRALKGEAYEVFSAGVSPTQVDPDAIKAMAEIMDIRFDIIVTVCDSAKEACPFFPGAEEQIHRSLGDPAAYEGEARLAAFRRVRDEIKEWIEGSF